ncbi:alpha/beta hydrolase [Kribbella pittospori]|uniref:Alpha/beta hydrolase n=1 Tax=Kribbella pittospori TaxID=722689 RepID=A0A4R0KHR7_9ACTN|nr:alpha/beta fold hydrolase [Kribbella pittospori]TCC59480.1 alpha/beta hydrolase [Kribbella pittospori]
MKFTRRALAGGVALGVATAGLVTLPVSATTTRTQIQWSDCKPEGKDDPVVVQGSQCATLQLPVDWRHPDGPTFGLAIARRTAKSPSERVGVLVFGPGGPGDSGVDRIKTGISRFSPALQDRFDIVSFDPRGIARSNPVLCSAALLSQQPSPLMKSQADFDATVRYNHTLATDCRKNTGPLYDHIDTWQTVRDVDAIRKALGESQISFHGSSYGTVLGAQYAETYPSRTRALVLESVLDHSSPTARSFLDGQAAPVQDSFDEFLKWCDQATDCALHGRDVHALWDGLLKRADQGEVPDPRQPNVAISAFNLSFAVFRLLYDPEWRKLADTLKTLDESEPPTGQAPGPTGLVNNTLAPFCQDWNLQVRDYDEFAGLVARIGRNNPDMRYPGQLLAVTNCLGGPTANNPQHRLKVRNLQTPVLLANAIHDPATGYNFAQSVTRQLGKYGVLLTYEGWGHGSYNSSPCMQSTIDDYLIAREVPNRGTSCAAVPPVG